MAASGEMEPSISTAVCFLQRHQLLSPALAGQGSCCAWEKGSFHVILPSRNKGKMAQSGHQSSSPGSMHLQKAASTFCEEPRALAGEEREPWKEAPPAPAR
jgi:hypothetical protein